jgi:glutathione peroxidase
METTRHTSIYSFNVNDLSGRPTQLKDYEGKVLVIVNIASKCGLRGQYQELETLYQTYKHEGFEILGFPCNQFANQEPGNSKEIGELCSNEFKITFPVFEKIKVNGSDTHPLWVYLKEQCPGLLGTQAIKWNFTKFLISRNGKPIERVAPKTSPLEMKTAIERELKTGSK